ncbi:MAG: hypothetical protein CYPHOPRED_002383 [Cyphobasidiales sp. Tagirdzhanova-0007]|nr:MAG: hypothetical protein CYPHOPRED_002383 [Cyphobasidiales sp. Tagirdzhanova-0007]
MFLSFIKLNDFAVHNKANLQEFTMVPEAYGKITVVFVCLGNICRSYVAKPNLRGKNVERRHIDRPMAQAVFQHLVKERSLEAHFDRIESAGTGAYHVGDEPDDRTIAKCHEKNIPIDSVAQAIQPRHFDFDFLICMDKDNLRDSKAIKPQGSKAQIKLFGEYGDGRSIQDPYYGGRGGFEATYQQVKAYSEGFLNSLRLGETASS